MMLDITLCYSMLECFLEINEPFAFENGFKVISSIAQHRKVINDELEAEWEEYFEKNRPDLLDSFHNYVSMITTNSVQSVFISTESTNYREKIVIDNKYQKIILLTCRNSKDRVLLSNMCYDSNLALKLLDIETVSIDQITTKSVDNKFFRYTLPIQNTKIEYGTQCTDISNWLGRFLEDENEILVIDNYIYQNRDNFFKYFISKVKRGANVKIYTLTDGITVEEIIQEFSHQRYSRWKIEVYIFKSKKHQHSRNIITNQYFIHLEKGMRVFGDGRRTEQSDLSICFLSDMQPYSISDCTKVM